MTRTGNPRRVTHRNLELLFHNPQYLEKDHEVQRNNLLSRTPHLRSIILRQGFLISYSYWMEGSGRERVCVS